MAASGVCSKLDLNLDLRRLHMVEPSRKRPQGLSEVVFLGSSGIKSEAKGQDGLRPD